MPPGLAHIFTVGSGYQLTERLRLDAAFEYSTSTGGNAVANMPNLAGEYKFHALGFHTGLAYNF